MEFDNILKIEKEKIDSIIREGEDGCKKCGRPYILCGEDDGVCILCKKANNGKRTVYNPIATKLG